MIAEQPATQWVLLLLSPRDSAGNSSVTVFSLLNNKANSEALVLWGSPNGWLKICHKQQVLRRVLAFGQILSEILSLIKWQKKAKVWGGLLCEISLHRWKLHKFKRQIYLQRQSSRLNGMARSPCMCLVFALFWTLTMACSYLICTSLGD